MKQKVRAVGIIREENGGILLLKRRMGRAEGAVLWELPTGKINFGEQPEEAMSRAILEYIGVQISSIKLKDVVTFLGLEGSSQLNNLFIIYEIVIQAGEKLDPQIRYSAYKYIKQNDDNNNGIRLTDSTLSVLEIEKDKAGGASSVLENIGFRKAASGATVYVDGSSRGNPGPAGIGYHIVDENGNLVKNGGEFIGFATSRVAEYYALKEGCEQARELGFSTVRFISDNLMMVNQMNGIYKVKNRDLINIYEDIQELVAGFDAVAFVHVKRNQNFDADREANLAIDRHFDEDMVK